MFLMIRRPSRCSLWTLRRSWPAVRRSCAGAARSWRPSTGTGHTRAHPPAPHALTYWCRTHSHGHQTWVSWDSWSHQNYLIGKSENILFLEEKIGLSLYYPGKQDLRMGIIIAVTHSVCWLDIGLSAYIVINLWSKILTNLYAIEIKLESWHISCIICLKCRCARLTCKSNVSWALCQSCGVTFSYIALDCIIKYDLLLYFICKKIVTCNSVSIPVCVAVQDDDGYVLTPVRLTIPDTPPSMREWKRKMMAKQGQTHKSYAATSWIYV